MLPDSKIHIKSSYVLRETKKAWEALKVGHGNPQNRQMNAFWVNPEQSKTHGYLRLKVDGEPSQKLAPMEGLLRNGIIQITEAQEHIQFHIAIASAGLMVFPFRFRLLTIRVQSLKSSDMEGHIK